MSKTIDQKVVEMRFDNRHFENNVKESMSTLEKLKQKLNLKDASKGLENLNTSANKVNMNGLTNSLDNVGSKFSALEVIGVTALANITNSAVNAGKRILSALTIDPVTTGFNEYELKMDSVRTIMASTGESVETVNKYLEELNKYSDQTIYSFSDMTQNIGKFTNAGVKLEDAVMAIKGISNEAAVSGANANEASRAMYNFAQALSAGYVKLIDWKSIENANMATVEFKTQLLESAVAVGTVTKTADGMYETLSGNVLSATQNFNETLQDQWMTTDVLVNTLKDYADAETEIGKKAFAAAQETTKFTQMLDVLKETAQSGWAKTWEIIFGDIEKAKKLFGPLTQFFSNIIDSISDFRNSILEGALGKSFRGVLDNIKKPFEQIEQTVSNIKNYAAVVDEIIMGKWGNGQKRWDALTQAGYDWAHAQNLVNEKLGFSLRRQTSYNKAQQETVKTQEQVQEATNEYILELIELSDAQLRSKGYTDEQISSLRELEKVSKKTGIPLKEFIENIDEIDGRWILLNSFKNIGQGLITVFKSIAKAWVEIFPVSETANGLFNAIASFHKFTTYLTVSEEAANNLKRTFKGLFAALDIVLTIVAGPIKIAFKIFLQLLNALDIGADGVLKFTANVGDAIVSVRDWLDSIIDFTGIFKFLAPYIRDAASAISKWFKNLAKSEVIQNFTKRLRNAKEAIKEWFEGLKETENIPKYIIQGLIKGLSGGINIVLQTMMEFGKKIIESICKVLGIESPSKEFFKIGKYIIQGLVNGIQNGAMAVWKAIKNVGLKCIEVFKKIDFGKLLAAGIGIGLILVVKNMISVIGRFTDVLENITAPLAGFGSMLDGIGDYFRDSGKAKKFKAMGQAMRDLALAVLILVASMSILAKMETGELIKSLVAVGILAVLLGVLATALAKIDGVKLSKKSGNTLSKVSIAILVMAGSLYFLAAAMKKMAGIDPDSMNVAINGLVAMVSGIAVLFAVYGKTASRWTSGNMDQAGKMIKKIATSLILMVVVVKLASMLKPEEMIKGLAFITIFGAFAAGLIAVSQFAGEHAKSAGKMISSITWSLLLLIAVFKLVSSLEPDEILKGVAFLKTAGVFFAALIAVSYLAGEHAKKAGAMLLMTSIALGIMVAVIKQIAGLSVDEISNGITVLAALGVFSGALIAISHFAGEHAIKAGTMLLLVSGALLILTGVLFLLSKMDIKSLYQALGIVAVLETLFGGLIFVSQYAKDSIKTLITLGVIITLLIAAVIGLSFINSKKLTMAAANISLIMGALAVLVASTKSMKISKNVPLALATLLGVVVALAGIIAVMSLIENPQSAIASSVALSTLLVALATSLKIIGTIKNVPLSGIGALALLGLVVAELGVILGVMNHFNITASIKTVTAISTLLLTMSGVLAILSIIGPASNLAYPAMLALGVLIVGLGAVLAALGLIQQKYDLEGLLNKGIPILDKIGYALGSFVGNIIGGLGAGLTSGLPTIGKNLTDFMSNAEGFISGAKNIDKKVVDGVTSIGKAITALVKAEFWSESTKSLFSDSPLVEIGKDLKKFGKYIKEYNDAIKGINLKSTVDTMTAASKLISAFSNIPKDGIFGTDGIDDFGRNLVSFGGSLKKYGTAVSGVDYESINNSIKPAKKLLSLGDAVPKDGWLGTDGIDDFGYNIWTFGIRLADYATAVKDLDTESIANSIEPAKSLLALAENMPDDGFFGTDGIDDFGYNISAFGTQMAAYATAVKDLDTTSIDGSIAPAKSLLELGTIVSEIDDGSIGTDGIDDFGKNIVSFGKSLGKYSKKVEDIDSKAISSSVDSVKKLIEVFSSMSNIETTNIKSFTDSLSAMKEFLSTKTKTFKKVGSSLIDSFTKGVKDKTNDVKDSAKSLIDSFASAIKEKTKDVKSACKSLSEKGVEAFCTKTLKKNAKEAGKDLVQGLINGLKDQTKRNQVYNAAYSLGQLAVQGEKDGQKSNSPSKATEQAGRWLGEGLVIGIQNMGRKVYNAGESMGKEATNSISHALNSAINLLDSDMDAQPTIRPVLDLSDVESGAGYLNSIFNNGPSIGVMSNLNAISRSMNTRSQNGANNDVVTAINKLRKDLGNVGGTTNNYNVNGVTYDDGSNITEAVRTLVRAATMERRV